MVEHTIDLQSLEIKQQSPNYSYIGLDENNELVRTTIDSSAFSNLISDVNTIKEDVNENTVNIGVVSGDVENLKIDNLKTQYVNISMYSGNERVGYSIQDGWYSGNLKYYLATINGQTLLQNKNIEIDLSNYYTKAEVDSMLAEINERLKGLN